MSSDDFFVLLAVVLFSLIGWSFWEVVFWFGGHIFLEWV